MKKLFLMLVAIVSFASVNAQEKTWLLYGNAGLNITSTSGTSTTAFNINPGFGYQFHKNMTVGVQGGYSNETYPGSVGDSVLSGYSAGAFFRYTHYLNNTFFLFAHLNAGYMSQTVDFPVGGSLEVTGFGAQITPAIGVNVGKGLALNFGVGGLGFSSMDYGATVTNFNLSFGQQFNIGISKNFGCCKKGGHCAPGDDMRHKHMKDMKDDGDDE